MISVKRILCPIDLTDNSVEALHYAIALAQAYAAKLYVCHCVERAGLPQTESRARIRQHFEQILHEQGESSAPSVTDYEVVLLEGDPATTIPRAAAERRIDLIVMRSRRRPLAAALLGSTAEAICRTAPCPVLVTHQNEHEWEGLKAGGIALRRSLIAHDFSNDSELALAYGLLLAQEYQAEVHLLHVLPYAPAPALASLPDGEAAAFHQAARRLQYAVPAEAFLVVSDQAGRALGPTLSGDSFVCGRSRN